MCVGMASAPTHIAKSTRLNYTWPDHHARRMRGADGVNQWRLSTWQEVEMDNSNARMNGRNRQAGRLGFALIMRKASCRGDVQ